MPHAVCHLTAVAQSPFAAFDSKPLLALYIGVGVFLILAIGTVVVLRLRRDKPGNGGLELDTDFLDGVGGAGGLTPEELLKVREAMVRQAMRRQEASSAPASSVSDLGMLAAAGKEAVGMSAPEADPATPASRAARPVSQTKPSGPPKTTQAPQPEDPPLPMIEPASKPRTRLANLLVDPAPEATSEPSPPPEKPSGAAIDLDALLERGLIDQAEYKRLQSLADQAGQDNT